MWNNDNLSRCHCFPCIYFAFNEQVRNNDNLSRCHCFPCIYFAFNQQEYAKIGSNIGTHCKNNLFWRKTKTVSVGWCGQLFPRAAVEKVGAEEILRLDIIDFLLFHHSIENTLDLIAWTIFLWRTKVFWWDEQAFARPAVSALTLNIV